MRLIGRRNFFAGLGLGAGAHLLGAMARTLVPEALGQAPRKRLFVYFHTLSWQGLPGGAADGSLVLSPAFKELEPMKGEMLMLDKLYNPFNKHLHGNFWSLSLAPGQRVVGGNAQAPGDVSFDRFAARTLSQGDPWPSLALIPVPINHFEIGGNILGYSADGPAKQFPAMREPFKAWNAVFGGAPMMTGQDPTQRLAREQSLLDFLTDDVNRMSARLAAPERAKMDQMLDAVRTTEQRLTGLARTLGACKKPAGPPGSIDDGIGPVATSPIKPEIIAAHLDIALTALTCGLTHVVNLTVAAGMSYTFLGEDGRVGQHLMWHDQGTPAKHLKYTSYHAGNLAAIRRRLAAVPDGGGTLADSTLLLVADEAGGKHHLGYNDQWVMLIGRAGGNLRMGRYVSYPKGERCVSDALVTAMNVLGIPGQTFGSPDACKGPLPGLF